MARAISDLMVCPSCGHENTRGSDACDHCGSDLTVHDVSESDLVLPLTEARLSRLHTLPPSATIREAVSVLRDDVSGAVVVVDGDEIVGIFTERDVLRHVAGHPERLNATVAAYMTPDPVILRDTDSMAVALNKMGLGGFRHIPLVHDGRLIAVVTGRDVLRWLMLRYFD